MSKEAEKVFIPPFAYFVEKNSLCQKKKFPGMINNLYWEKKVKYVVIICYLSTLIRKF